MIVISSERMREVRRLIWMSSLGRAVISAREMDEKISEAVAVISVTFLILMGCRLERIYVVVGEHIGESL
jgi:hypothetical protein